MDFQRTRWRLTLDKCRKNPIRYLRFHYKGGEVLYSTDRNMTPHHINETFSPVSNQYFSIYYHNKMNYIEYTEPLAYFDMICKI